MNRLRAPPLAEFVGERDEELPVTLALVRRQSEDAREVVVFLGVLLLGKVTHHVVALRRLFRQDVKQKGLHVVVQRLVVQKELGQQAQVLAVHASLNPGSRVHSLVYVCLFVTVWS